MMIIQNGYSQTLNSLSLMIVKSSKFSIATKTPNRKRTNPTPLKSYPQQSAILSRYIHHKNSPPNTRAKRNLTQMSDTKSPFTKEGRYFEKKEKELIAKLLKTKMQKRERKKWHNFRVCDNMTIKKNTLPDFQSLEFQILKPTDKFFQKMENVRLAEKILLAKPSVDLNRGQLSTFYKQQKHYQINIRKMPSRQHSTSTNRKSFSHKNWID